MKASDDFSYTVQTPIKHLLNRVQVLREGNRGYGILVSSIPKESDAFYSLKDPSEVRHSNSKLLRDIF